ncbi:MAG TPA: DUF2934 domain-containing protein [Steroidobacteraceae bacterium]|nr:DUF2934 domain-containing protein [Steroidobacteraceae bacterium]
MATRRTQESGQSLQTKSSRALRSRALPAAPAAAGANVSAESRRGMIAEAAYWRAERRGFAPGNEMDDWLAAEREVDAFLSSHSGSPQ